MSKDKKKQFTRKPYNSFLYVWSPELGVSYSGNKQFNNSGNPVGCSAPAFSQGEDWVTTYVYEFVSDTHQHHYAYVECDYVK